MLLPGDVEKMPREMQVKFFAQRLYSGVAAEV